MIYVGRHELNTVNLANIYWGTDVQDMLAVLIAKGGCHTYNKRDKSYLLLLSVFST